MRLVFIGFGEVGYHFARHLADKGLEMRTYCRRRELVEERAREAGVRLCATFAEALEGAQVIFSCVWPQSALPVAREAASWLRPGQLYADANTVGPSAAQHLHEAVAPSGADFAKVAIMGGVAEGGGRTPLIVGGPGAERLAGLLAGWEMNVRVLGADVRAPAALKILRAYGLKGMVAVAYEMVRAARRYGIDQEVLTSAGEMLEWPGFAKRLSDRIASAAIHAGRRAQEMDEVAETLAAVGLDSQFAAAIRRVFEGIATSSLREVFGETPPASYREVLEAVEHRCAG